MRLFDCTIWHKSPDSKGVGKERDLQSFMVSTQPLAQGVCTVCLGSHKLAVGKGLVTEVFVAAVRMTATIWPQQAGQGLLEDFLKEAALTLSGQG